MSKTNDKASLIDGLVMCNLYKHIEIERGYMVYRDVFDLNKCGLYEGAMAHKIATFIAEEEAENYCQYRNYMTEKYGNDGLDSINFYT